MNQMLRTHTCGELRSEDVNKHVSICGWVNKYRDLGGLHFMDLRDKYGVTQLSFGEYLKDNQKLEELKKVSLESVVRIEGIVNSRPLEAKNKNMPTGEVEISVTKLELLSRSDIDSIPFLPFGAVEATDDLKLKYRYLELRTNKLQDILKLRSQACFMAREVLMSENFVEVETPILYKSTPEGARDYIVPSRVNKNKVYALPQSPQTLKQLLMIGGTDRYFQICRCFRDEDLRADRQPEFSQIDIEASFITQDFIRELATKIIKRIFKLEADFKLPMMDFKTAMDLYGSDKPDIRFGLKHMNVTDLFKDTEFGVFKDAVSSGLIKTMFVPEKLGVFSRKMIDSFVEVVKPYGGKGVAWFKLEKNQRTGGISKYITEEIYKKLDSMSEEKGDGIWLFFADKKEEVAHASADALRRYLGKELKLHRKGYAFLWVYDFPLFEYSEEENRLVARHHPFTMPKKEFLNDFLSDDMERQKKCLADAYDLVCNGYEIAGGSMRIFNTDVQSQMFKILKFTEEETRNQFGFFIDALKYGTPPHGGMAFGLDRLIMLICNTDNIRDVIAFPKTTSASDLMAGSPSAPSIAQLDELNMRWK